MTTLISADWHLSENPRDEYRFKGIATIRSLVKKHKVDRLLILGDLCEAKDRHGAELVNRVVNELYELSGFCSVTILRGNHHYIVADSPFYAFLSRIDGISWINNPTQVNWKRLGRCLFLPHTSNWKKDWEGLPLKDQDWVFAHNTFEGADVGHGHKMPGIPIVIFPDTYVIAGDVHVPQRLGPVTYVGAPYTIDFGDTYTPRVFLIKDDSGIPHDILMQGPQKRLIELTSRTLADLEGANEGDIVKIRVQLEPGEYARWAEIREAAKATAEEAGLIVHIIQPVVEKQGKTTPQRQVHSSRSDEQLLRLYAKLRDVDSKTLDVGLKLIQES